MHDVYRDREGLFWLATNAGLLHVDPVQQRVMNHYQPDLSAGDTSTPQRENVMLVVFQDADGVLWLGTIDAVGRLNPEQTKFTTYEIVPADTGRLNNAIRALAGGADNTLWIHNNQWLAQADFASGQASWYRPQLVDAPMPPTNPSALYPVNDGTIWLGYVSNLYHFDPAMGGLHTYNQMPIQHTINPIISSIYDDGEGSFWLTMERAGFYRFERASETFTRYLLEPNDPFSIGSNDVRTITADRAGHLWVGSGTGVLSRYDPQSGRFTNYRHDPNDPSSISSGRMQDIHEDRQGILWIASMDGLNRFDPQTETFQRYAEQNGLPDARVNCIQEDAAGQLWLGTNNGLARFDPQAETFRNYDLFDGVGIRSFQRNGCCQLDDGWMVFAGGNRLTIFHPEQLHDSTYQSPVVLTALHLDYEQVAVGAHSPLQRPIWQTNHLTLQPHQDRVSFDFAALSYAASHKNRYQYMLEGYDPRWREADARRRSATYTNLPAGAYVLRVRGSNQDGVWSEQQVVLRVTVLPPWWETWWFRYALAALSLAMLVGGYRWRVHTIQ